MLDELDETIVTEMVATAICFLHFREVVHADGAEEFVGVGGLL